MQEGKFQYEHLCWRGCYLRRLSSFFLVMFLLRAPTIHSSIRRWCNVNGISPHTIWNRNDSSWLDLNVDDQKVLCILHCIWRVHLGISFLAAQSLGPHPGDLTAAPACLLSRPVFYCGLSLQNDIWVEEWERGSGHSAEEASFSIVEEKLTQESNPLSGQLVMPETLYLCNIFAVWSLISQLCSF